jgi:hypothetical protein
MARDRGAFVVFGGIHASLYPGEAREFGRAHAVVQGDGDIIWATVLADCHNGGPQPLYDGGRVNASRFQPARWELLPPDRYMWASVQTVRVWFSKVPLTADWARNMTGSQRDPQTLHS